MHRLYVSCFFMLLFFGVTATSSASQVSWQNPIIPNSALLYSPTGFPTFSSLIAPFNQSGIPSAWTQPKVPSFAERLAKFPSSWTSAFPYERAPAIPVVPTVPKNTFPAPEGQTALPKNLTPVRPLVPAPDSQYAPEIPVQTDTLYIAGLSVEEGSVRIMNGGLTSIDLTGWRIGNGINSINFMKWPLGNGKFFRFTVQPHMAFTVHTGKRGTVSATDLYWPFERLWNPSGEHVAYLYDPKGNLVSSLTGQ